MQGSWAQAENASDWIHWVVSPTNGRPNAIFANNPFLDSGAQLAAGIERRLRNPRRGPLALSAGRAARLAAELAATPPPPPTTPYLSGSVVHLEQRRRAARQRAPNRMYRTLGDQKSWNAETGAHRRAGWYGTGMCYYNHGNSELTVTNPNNTDNAKYLASLDAVLDGGTIKCWVTTPAAVRRLYPGCVPTNITDPAGPSAAAYDYLRTQTSWTLTQELDDVGFSIGGGLWGLGFPRAKSRPTCRARRAGPRT